jgi:plasmid maintenance system antidote protein VapI
MEERMGTTTKKSPISGGLLRILRMRRLTAYGVAKKAGVSTDAVQRFMNSERGLSLTTVDKLAHALGLKLCGGGRGKAAK